MIHVVAVITARPGRRDEVLTHFHALVPEVRAEKGCIEYVPVVDADTDLAAPIAGGIAANANVAAPIDAAVAANVGSVDSDAIAVSQQDAIITQDITGTAEANAAQDSDITQ